MKKLTPQAKLDASIILLETKQAEDEVILKEGFKSAYEKMKPINLIKRAVDDFITSPDLKENIVDTTLSLTAGYLSKKIVFGNSSNPIKQMVGSLIQIGVTNAVSKNTDSIKAFVSKFVDKLLHKKVK